MRPLNMHDDGEMEGVNSVVFLCDTVHVDIPVDDSAALVERVGDRVVLKCLMTPTQVLASDRRSKVYANMLERQAADHVVLTGMPPHPNVVPVLHHFVAPALLVRPFVPLPLLEYFSVTQTT